MWTDTKNLRPFRNYVPTKKEEINVKSGGRYEVLRNRIWDVSESRGLIEKRYPIGWGGAGVVHTSKGNYYTSVSIETANASAIVCIELGAMLEAHKYNEKVTHCMCIIRDDESSPYRVLSPCGICQERLRYWGENVQVAVTTEEKKIRFVELKELQPYHWTKAYPADELEHWEE